MGMTIDDDVKQKLLDSLAKEPPMVLSTAYAYAKNYVEYGEDITKAWTTAVQQASIIEQIKIKVRAEAYNSFKKDYENRLKADMVAMLTEIQLEIEELRLDIPLMSRGYECYGFEDKTAEDMRQDCSSLIQEKINALKENEDAVN